MAAAQTPPPRHFNPFRGFVRENPALGTAPPVCCANPLLSVSAVDCIDPSCSAHGVCIHGECHCQPGWGGASCEIAKAMCPDQCSGHGTYNAETSTCTCNQNWTGPDCSLGRLGWDEHKDPCTNIKKKQTKTLLHM